MTTTDKGPLATLLLSNQLLIQLPGTQVHQLRKHAISVAILYLLYTVVYIFGSITYTVNATYQEPINHLIV